MWYNIYMVRLLAVIFATLLLMASSTVVLAQKPEDPGTSNIPEKNGDYPDPDHPGVRVRVFVHEAGKPQPTTSNPVLACTDLDSTAVVDPAPWKLPSGTWTYQLNVNSVPSAVGGGNFQTLATNAFNSWQGVQNTVTFSRGADTNANRQSLDFKNIVSWGRTSGSALAVTYTRYYTATHLVADVDTIMNQKFAWNWTDPLANTCSLYSNTYDAQDILTHELGHWMGLNDHYTSAYVDNTMFGYGSAGEIKKDTLTTGDTNGVKAIYP